MIESSAEGKWTEGSHTKLCLYAVYEVARGGELFSFVALGPLPEKMARMFFNQLMSAIEYIHS
jgi:5'-AMP-activated protein kinase, catalytic alpha subunit